MEHVVTASVAHKTFSWPWWVGGSGQRPLIILGLAIFFATVALIPVPKSMVDLATETNAKGAKYKEGTNNYVDSYNKLMDSDRTPEEVAQKMKLCVAMLFTIALLWGTEAIALAATDILVGIIMYLFVLLPINMISKAYMKDAVFFIAGVLILAAAVGVTGLDRRIGNILMGKIKGLKGFCFIFFPTLAVIAGFLSEHALVALLCPILILVYMEGERRGDLSKKQLHMLACTLFLGICYAANVGGSGSPAVGGRSAIMIGYFYDYGLPMSFGTWMMYGLPLVPFIAVSCSIWIYLTLARRTGPALHMDLGSVMRKGVEGMGPLRGKELTMALLFAAQVVLWIGFSSLIGLGGATVLVVLIILVLGLMTWDDIQARVRFDVVGLYAGACAMGVALKYTGAGVWLANQFVGILPGYFSKGMGIVLSSSLITTIMTNFMSDGAAVGALGPVVLPMAAIGGVHLWKVGLACSFGSSYAHGMIVGTVNNAIAYGMAKHPETGERLLSPFDFVVYGIPFVVISLLVLWFVAFFGYWQFLPWPAVGG
ncbi:MAG: anion permease [Desulfobacterales bacterium]|nr:anion permease [Desulfobacterales bacterium]